jgi:hypothetical protein
VTNMPTALDGIFVEGNRCLTVLPNQGRSAAKIAEAGRNWLVGTS